MFIYKRVCLWYFNYFDIQNWQAANLKKEVISEKSKSVKCYLAEVTEFR